MKHTNQRTSLSPVPSPSRPPQAVELLDTTLRDGAQTPGIHFPVAARVEIAAAVAALGIPLVEGGWPGASPTETEFFSHMQDHPLEGARLVAFGATMHSGSKAEEAPSLRALLAADTQVVVVFGKSWEHHTKRVLRVSPEENLRLISESVTWLRAAGRRVIYDAEHFFDGFRDDPEFALNTLRAAASGAERPTLVLCDTNGGSLPEEVREVTARVCREFPEALIGIHAHNDAGLAVANTLAAVQAGARHVQGTINGYGERCGNADLVTVIANLECKLGLDFTQPVDVARLYATARTVAGLARIPLASNAPFVGDSAFTHKAGVHTHAILKHPSTYEHMDPSIVGGRRRMVLSELTGRAAVSAYLAGVGLNVDREQSRAFTAELKRAASEGHDFEATPDSAHSLALRYFHPERVLRVGDVRAEEDERGRTQVELTLSVGADRRRARGTASDPMDALIEVMGRHCPACRSAMAVVQRVEPVGDRWLALASVTSGGNTWKTSGVASDALMAAAEAIADGLTLACHAPG